MRFPWAIAVALLPAIVTLLPGNADAQAKPAPPSAALPLTTAWNRTLDAAPAAEPAYDSKRAFLALQATGQVSAQLVAVSLANGEVAWKRPVDGVRFLAAGDDLVFTARTDSLVAFNGSDGEPAWKLALDSAPAVSLATAGDWLILPAEKEIVAIRAREGTVVWRRPLDSPPVATPVFAGDAAYVGVADGRVVRLALTTGAIVWQASLPAPASTLLALDDRVFVGTSGRFFYALNPRNGRKHWRVRIGSDVVGTPAVDRSLVYFLSLDNLIRGVDRGNGSLRARRVLTRRALFGPYAAGDYLLVSGMTQTIEAFKFRTLQAAGLYDAGAGEQAGIRFAGPLHVAAGTTADDMLIVGVTGEGDVIALRRSK